MARNHRSDENWVTNMYQKIEATFQDIDDFVYKEPVLFVGNQVQTFVEIAAVKETTVRQNISKPKEALVVPEMRHQPSISALQQLIVLTFTSSINLILLVKVNAVRHKLTTAVES
ncbi:hypothetical protein Tco_1480548 [Tanacetum coccineum]